MPLSYKETYSCLFFQVVMKFFASFWKQSILVKKKDTFLQTWKNVYIFSCLSYTAPRQDFSIFQLLQQTNFFQQKLIKFLAQSIDQLNVVAHYCECLHFFRFNCKTERKKNWERHF